MLPSSSISTNRSPFPPPASTSNPAPSAARIRENQRRSRARRKEYIQELEQKLRKCEQAGVKASVDIQLAARGVALENTRLRDENERLRVEGEKLREENERLRAGLVDGKEQQAHDGATIGDLDTAGGSTLTVENVELRGPSQVQDSTDQRQVQEPTTMTKSNEIYAKDIQMPPGSLSKVSCVNRSNEMVLGDDTSSCEYAAHIITSMRADISTDDVRADLGCGGDVREWRKCKVDNSKLFVAVDRYAG